MDEVALKADKLFNVDGPYYKKDPRSLINIMPKEARRTLENMSIAMLTMDETHIEAMVKPTPYLNQVRVAFWQEYDAAQASNTSMTLKGIQAYMGHGSPSILLREHFANERSLAWILVPPTHYDSLISEALDRGLRRIQSILDLPMMNPDGTIDHKAVDLVMKATAFLDMRKNGMFTERREIKQLSVNITKNDVKALGMTRPDELDRKIKELEKRLVSEG